MNILALLQDWDNRALHFANVTLGNPVMDQVWLILTHLERQWWFGLIVAPAIFLWLIYIYGMSALKPLFIVGLAVALSDSIAYRVVKTLVNRPRPFENPEIASWLRHVGDAHGPSFPSNHAANCFAAAVILAWYFPVRRAGFYILAALIGFSRIALGVHYPSDVLGGAILGIFVGLLIKVCILNHFDWWRVSRIVSKSGGDSYHWRKRIRRLEQD